MLAGGQAGCAASATSGTRGAAGPAAGPAAGARSIPTPAPTAVPTPTAVPAPSRNRRLVSQAGLRVTIGAPGYVVCFQRKVKLTRCGVSHTSWYSTWRADTGGETSSDRWYAPDPGSTTSLP